MTYEKILAKLVQAKKKTEEIHKLITSLIEEVEKEQKQLLDVKVIKKRGSRGR